MTALIDRAAKSLDDTHAAASHFGIDTEKMRNIVAAWLDDRAMGKRSKLKISFVRRAVAYLEMIASQQTIGKVAS